MTNDLVLFSTSSDPGIFCVAFYRLSLHSVSLSSGRSLLIHPMQRGEGKEKRNEALNSCASVNVAVYNQSDRRGATGAETRISTQLMERSLRTKQQQKKKKKNRKGKNKITGAVEE